jgi:hypothetical protein
VIKFPATDCRIQLPCSPPQHLTPDVYE